MEPEECIFFQLANAGKAGTRHWRDQVAPFGVTSTQALVLACLVRDDQISAKQLGKTAHLDSATLAGTLDRMVKSGLVERRDDPEDRRAVRICLTPLGRKKGAGIRGIIQSANQGFLSKLSPAEAMMLRELLKKLYM